MLIALLLGQNLSPYTAQHGVVVSDNLLASQAGRDVMKWGGNAVDAAVATALALAVVHPDAGNLGGGGFMVVRLKNGQSAAIDYREVAPKRATRDMFLKDASASTVGYLAVALPGTPAGLGLAQKRYGKLKWSQVVEPALRLARDGYVLGRERAASIKGRAPLFRKFEESYRVFNRCGQYYVGGERFKQPDLAATLARLKQFGPEEFYRGRTAELLAKDMASHGGLISRQDLAAYRPKVRELLHGTFEGYDIWTMPPPSSGGVALLQMLGTIDGKLQGYYTASTVNTMVEAMKRAFADRAEFMGDPDFVNVPVERLLAADRISEFRKEVGERATPSDQIRPKIEQLKDGNHTTHFSVVDGEGNAVACTTTLNTGYGSGVVVKGAGFFLNNEMDDFTSAPGRPNVFGLIQGEANVVVPGKRPLSSMTPTIVTRNGKLFLVLGSPGGPTIINTVMQTIVNVVHYKMDVRRAVTTPRFHHQWKPDQIAWEPFGFSDDLIAALKARGQMVASKPGSIGSCHAIQVLSDGWLAAGADPRLPEAGSAGY